MFEKQNCQDKKIIIPCNFDNRAYSQKPPSGEIGAIRARVAKKPYNAPLEKVVKAVAYDGRTMGVFKCHGQSSKNFVAGRQFILDFDSDALTKDAKAKDEELARQYKRAAKDQGVTLSKEELKRKVEAQRTPNDFMPILTPEQVRERLKDYGIEIGYAFYSPSHLLKTDVRGQKLPKFKVVIIAEEIITDPITCAGVAQGVIDIFPEVDASGKDLARLCFGSTKGLIWTR